MDVRRRRRNTQAIPQAGVFFQGGRDQVGIAALEPAQARLPAHACFLDLLCPPTPCPILVAFLVADHLIVEASFELPASLHADIHQPDRQEDALQASRQITGSEIGKGKRYAAGKALHLAGHPILRQTVRDEQLGRCVLGQILSRKLVQIRLEAVGTNSSRSRRKQIAPTAARADSKLGLETPTGAILVSWRTAHRNSDPADIA